MRDTRPHARTRARAAIALTAALACALTATAQAQEDPYATVEEQAETSDLDTDLTPVAKDTELWTLVHGTPYPKTRTVEGSVTTFDTELFDVSFRNTAIGLAGGSACETTPVQLKDEDDTVFGERASACRDHGTQVDRVPALYRYTAPVDGDAKWERLELPGEADPGYIGAITWIDGRRALIVGGTGKFPRREEPYDGTQVTDPAKADVAGEARAWVYTRASSSAPERVEELDLSALTPETPATGGDPARAGMRGLSAVGCYVDPTPGIRAGPNGTKVFEPERELCFAGALGQIWRWDDGGFTADRVDAQSPATELANPSLFSYRVRDLAFSGLEPPVAVAVTSGCCGASETDHKSRTLVYNDDTTYPRNLSLSPGYQPGPSRWFAGVNETPELPDSFYSLTLRKGKWFDQSIRMSVIASPGGRESPGEKPSVVSNTFGQGVTSSGQSLQSDPVGYPLGRTGVIRTSLSTTRLVSGDGDIAWREARPVGTAAPNPGGDDVPDWAVGELRSTGRTGLGARGLVVATALPPTASAAINEGRGSTAPTVDEVSQGEYEPVDQEKLNAHVRSRHFLLPSYSATSVDIVGDEEAGWAVGEHGAILRLETGKLQDAAAASEPEPPALGAPRPRPLSDRGAYDAARPALPSSTGIVPPVGGETIEVDEPQMVPSGRLGGGISQIVMSRDGTEGVAIGRDGGGPTFVHFDGVSWTRCDPVGIKGRVSPDSACSALAPLRGFRDASGDLKTFDLSAAARVPLENDSDPTNDDELEVVAFGQGLYSGPENEGKPRPPIAVYRHGRWRFGDASSLEGANVNVRDLAFTAPDDGWLLGGAKVGEKEITERVFHFDGEHWVDCSLDHEICGDAVGAAARIPKTRQEIDGLTAAGNRVYLYGSRKVGAKRTCLPLPGFCVEECVGSNCTNRSVPLILYHEPGGRWTDGAGPDEDGGGMDPAFEDKAVTDDGHVESLSVVAGQDGYEGWAVGAFSSSPGPTSGSQSGPRIPPETALFRLEPGSGWQGYESPGALEDYFLPAAVGFDSFRTNEGLQVTYPSASSPDGTFIGQENLPIGGQGRGGRIFGFNSARKRFDLLDSARPQGAPELNLTGEASPAGHVNALAPDGSGGFWAVVDDYLFHYTDRVPKPVLSEVPHPLGIRGAKLRDLTGGPDGSVWAATDSDRLFRHDRIAGWEEVRIGWDPGRVVTRTSQAAAIAVGPGGEGLVVGEGGRIAELSPTGVVVDAAAGRSCALGDAIPCGTSRDLEAVDVAPDGSAIAGGERLALLWRPAGGEFRVVSRPPISSATTIEGVSFPTPTRAYLATNKGIVFRGDMSGEGSWRWQVENSQDEELISLDADNDPIPIRDVAVDASGHGYAVGDEGLVMERSAEGTWRRLPTRHPEDLTVAELPEMQGEGVLVGGENGLVLTGVGGELRVARPADFSGNPSLPGDVVGFAYLPGAGAGAVDAWAAIEARGAGDSRLLRYRSDEEAVGLPPGTPALPDAPGQQPGELSLAAFGKADCDKPEVSLCPEMSATTTTNEVISGRIVNELASLRGVGELDLAIQTGDATDSAGLPASSLADYDELVHGPGLHDLVSSPIHFIGQVKHRRYAELVTDELEERGVTPFGALGGQDLSETFACNPEGRCEGNKRFANAGENYAWREAFAGRTGPWGDGSRSLDAESEIQFEPAPGSEDNSLRIEDQRADADGAGSAPEVKAEIGGAATHYAIDATRDGEPIARIVFVDSSLRSLAASDALQQPQELAGGQLRFLERMICREGEITSFGDPCTRQPAQRAVVVSNTPTYSYGPGALTHTATDGNVFEALMLKHRVDLVVSGALGYNGLYYTLAPGIHEPCPAGEYPQAPPSGQTPDCLAGPAGPAEAATENAPAEAPDPASLIAGQGLAGAYPTLIAAGAGGKFGPDGGEPADGPAGQWHGYSLTRLLPNGDLVVEQRPILDWVGLDAPEHAMAPKSRLQLNGYGRSPISTTTEGGQGVRAFHYEISNPAITHRYELVLADPDAPWLPCDETDVNCQELHANLSKPSGKAEATPTLTGTDNPCSPYLCLPSRIGAVDGQSGLIRAGDGKYPETFAVAMLSVDEELATYPLVFKRSPSFVATPAIRSGALPNTAGTRPTAPPPPPPPPGLPQIPQVDIPQIPPPPGIPQLTAATPPELQPPAPPAPPPPSQQPAPLDLSVAPPGVSISTPTALIQPPTPPVNPAPPGGARREARQRQAAAQKGGADSGEDASDGAGGDLAQTPDNPTAASTRYENAFLRGERSRPEASFSARHDRPRPEPSFTAHRPAGDSPFGPGVLYFSGIALLAFALATGWRHGRPTPRRHQPEIPAPAWSRTGHRRRH